MRGSAVIYDCHSHLSFLDRDRVELFLSDQNPQSLWIQGGYGPDEWQRQLFLAQCFPQNIKCCFGLHPWYLAKISEDQALEDLEKLKIHYEDQSIFIGEIGLDRSMSLDDSQLALQKWIFIEQLKISSDQPRVLHVVQAHGETQEILKKYPGRGLIHGFSGSLEVAKIYIELGYLISIGPNILNPQFKKLRQAAKQLPLDKILIESDSPSGPSDTTPISQKYWQVANHLAEQHQISPEDLVNKIKSNLNKIL